MWDMILDSLLDALIDSAKMLPFLYIIYLLMEVLEHKAGKRFPRLLLREDPEEETADLLRCPRSRARSEASSAL